MGQPVVAARLSEASEAEIGIDDLNVRPDLDHSSLLGKAATRVRTGLKRLPRGPIRKLEAIVPRKALESLFPERKYVDSGSAKNGDHRRRQ
jgi:hypothetical protein